MIEVIKSQLRKIVKSDVEVDITASEKADFGHYSTNVAFKLAPLLKKAPLEIAKELAQKLSSPSAGSGSIFAKIEAVAPGFVNFWLAPEFLQKETAEVLKQGKSFGKLRTRFPRKINVEFVSANPTGPLTMANGRGGFYGDVLCNVLEKAGHDVTREYYVNDMGHQMKSLGLSIWTVREGGAPKEGHYQGEYIYELAKDKRLARFEVADILGKEAAKILLGEIKQSLKLAGIKHDEFFSEDKKLHKTGEVTQILKFLEKEELTEKKDDGTDAIFLKGTDIVLVKSDRDPTYFLVDLAYHFNKLKTRNFDLAINIWGTDHHGAAARLKTGIELVGIKPEKLKIILTQLVRLVKDGKEVKMSKRAGEFVTMDELLKEVGADVARFFFLMHSPDTHMDFDLDLAKEKSQKNPVYYVQYAYVRALNILKKLKNEKQKADLSLLKSESEIKLMLELLRLPDVVAECAEDYQVQRLTKYAMELAGAFHNFYEKERVVGIGGELEKARLGLVNSFKIVFEELLSILGTGKPKKM